MNVVVGPKKGSPDVDPKPEPLLTAYQRTVLRVVFFLWALWGFALLFLLPTLSLGAWVSGVVVPPLAGGIGGFGLGIAALGKLFAGHLSADFAIGLLSALGGALAAFIIHALHVRNELGRSLLSTIFSKDLFQSDPAKFACQVLVGAFVGYIAGAGLFETQLFAPPSGDPGDLATAVIGGGSSGGGDGALSFWPAVLTLLVVMIVAAIIIGGVSGGLIGAVLGSVWQSADARELYGPAAFGAMARFLKHYRPERGWGKRSIVITHGAVLGTVEGMIAGAGTALVLFIAKQWE